MVTDNFPDKPNDRPNVLLYACSGGAIVAEIADRKLLARQRELEP